MAYSSIGASTHEPGSYNLHEGPISTQRIIVSQQNHRLNPGLRNQKPVEGILVNGWQLNYFRGVLACYRQVVEDAAGSLPAYTTAQARSLQSGVP